MIDKQLMEQALEALEKVTKEMLAVRDELAERGCRPMTNVFHQRLWDSSFDAYANHAMPAAEAIRARLEQPEQEPVARVIDNGTPEGATEWIPFTNRVEPLKTGDLLYTTPPAAPVQEPVAWQWLTTAHFRKKLPKDAERGAWNPLYTTPPAAHRQWVGLTDEEHMQLAEEWGCMSSDWIMYAAALERKIKEKNT